MNGHSLNTIIAGCGVIQHIDSFIRMARHDHALGKGELGKRGVLRKRETLQRRRVLTKKREESSGTLTIVLISMW